MASMVSASFEHHFQDLPDPRIERARKHPLINIVFVAVCGVLCGANSFAAIHEFAIDRRNWLARYLDLTNGIPSEDTLVRVLARLDPGAFEKCLMSWIEAVQEVTENRLVAIDGKTVRGSSDHGDTDGRPSTWSRHGRRRTSCRWARLWSTRNPTRSRRSRNSSNCWRSPGRLVTIDAMGCQKEIAEQIRERKADYALAVKQNQPTLYEQVEEAIGEALEQDAEGR